MNINRITRAVCFSEIFELYGTNWKNIIKHPNLSSDFIDTYFTFLKPYFIEKYQTIPKYLQLKYKNHLNWIIMSKYQQLDEDIIILMQTKVNWLYISKYQKLSENFIKKYHNKLNYDFMTLNKQISVNTLINVKNLFIN